MNVSQTLLNHFCPNSSFLPVLDAFLLAISRAVVNAVQSSVRLGKQAANPSSTKASPSNRKSAGKSEEQGCVKDTHHTAFWRQHWSIAALEK